MNARIRNAHGASPLGYEAEAAAHSLDAQYGAYDSAVAAGFAMYPSRPPLRRESSTHPIQRGERTGSAREAGPSVQLAPGHTTGCLNRSETDGPCEGPHPLEAGTTGASPRPSGLDSSPSSSPSAGDCGDHSVGDRQVAGADSGAPATAPALLIVGTVDDMHAVTMPMVENLGSPHISCLDHLAGQAIDYSGHTPRVPDSYRSVILDIRIVGDVRLQRVLDRLFAPGRGSRVEVIDLAALWAEVEA